MTKSVANKIQELRRIVSLHADWLVWSIVGDSALSKSELEELHKYKKLPMDKNLNLMDKAFALGRLRALLKTTEFSKVSYEDLVEKGLDMSDVEKLTLEQLKLKGSQYLRNVTQTINNDVISLVSKALDNLTEGKIIISGLAKQLSSLYKKSWKDVSQTELQRGKVQGQAQTVASKRGVYTSSSGIESDVSIIPGKNCCSDCNKLYLDSNGNPKVFKLSDLLSVSNTNHSKTKGIHTNWKATLPPLHKNCGCQLKYLPPGYGWSAGKLSLLNKSLFEEALLKAKGTGVDGGIHSTIKPAGPEGSKKPVVEKMPSLPGAAAPTNLPGPGRPKGISPKPGSGTAGGLGGGQQLVACPFGGGADCIAHGGNGATQHEANGQAMKDHQAAMMAGAQPKTDSGKEQQQKMQDQASKQFGSTPHPHDVIKKHLSEGKIGHIRKLGDAEGAGVNATFKVNIVGNGAGAMKASTNWDDPDLLKLTDSKSSDEMVMSGAGTVSRGTNHNNEVAAHGLATTLGLSDHVPVTTLRQHNGEGGAPKAQMSIQAWQEDYKPTSLAVKGTGKHLGNYDNLISIAKDNVPEEHKAKVFSKLADIAVMDVVMNSNDRHVDNLIWNKDFSDVKAIDHGFSFANGMQGHRNDIAFHMDKEGIPLSLTPHMEQRLRNVSFEEMKRGTAESGVKEWATAQSWLRAKYAVHLHDSEGFIPTDAISGSVMSADGRQKYGLKGNGYAHPLDKKFLQDMDSKNLAEDKFNRFAKAHLLSAAGDVKHPDHEDAKAILALKPLMGDGMAIDTDAYRKSGKLDSHWNSIDISNYDLKKVDPEREKYLNKGRNFYKAGATTPIRTPPPKVTREVQPPSKPLSLDLSEFGPEPNSTVQLKESDLEPAKEAEHAKTARPGKMRKALYLADLGRRFPLTDLS